jgi:isoquinoline 1-oxidoreductase beta subunit
MSSTQPATPTAPAKRRWRLTRRGFLIGAGLLGTGLALGIPLGTPYARLKIAEFFNGEGGPPTSYPTDPFAWFEILPDSRIRLYLSKVEMGQGIHTALAQIALEELEIPLVDLEIAQATTTVGPTTESATSGSSSVSATYLPLRQVAATLRELLRSEAARSLGQPAENLLLAERGFAVAADPTQRISFHEIVTGHQGAWEIPDEAPPLKAVTEFQVIGQPMLRSDIPAKVTGQAIYGYDVRLPGMKYGAIARPPTIAGKLTAAEPGAAQAMSGVHTVVIEEDFAGVVADSRAQAQAALGQLALTWDEGRLWQQADLDQMIVADGSGGITIQKSGNAARALDEVTTLTAEYRTPFAVQTPLEAQAALAEVGADRARLWVSTQMQGRVRGVVAEALGMDEAQIEIIPTYLGGGFGRKSGFEVAVEAARLAKAAGVPVHVGWTRTEELRYGYFRPPTHHRLAARLDDNGQIVALEHRQASGDVAFGFLPGLMTTIMGADFGAYRGAQIRYAIPHVETITWRKTLPVRTGWWRGLGLLANVFAVESFVDELAHLAGADPLQFRLAHLPADDWGRRMRAVLEAVADKAGWGTPLPAGRARGIACCSDVGTMVAEVAEVSLDETTGRIRVHEVTAAMDCGLTINPDGAQAQVEGNVMWGVGSTLLEEVRVKDGRIDLNNFETYPLLTLRDAPHVQTVLLEAGDGKPRGVGEPPIGPVAAAIGNAFFALAGQRIRQLPMTPERIQSVTA